MDHGIYCVWCGTENPTDQKLCSNCGKKLEAKENLLVDFLVEHTKDKLKGDVEDGLFQALKNYLLSHLYSVIITVALVATAVTAVALPDPTAHIEQVSTAPEIREYVQETASVEALETQQVTEPGMYVLTQEDKTAISDCLQAFTDCMEYTRYVGGDREFLNYMISDELETAIGYDSFVDMYADHVMDDVYQFSHCEYGELVMDQDSWSTEPLTQNGKELVELGYTVATCYADYSFYGKLTGMSDAPTVLIGSPRYLMTFALENDQWLLVEQLNITDRWEERQDVLL